VARQIARMLPPRGFRGARNRPRSGAPEQKSPLPHDRPSGRLRGRGRPRSFSRGDLWRSKSEVLTIDDVGLLLPGDQLFVRHEIVGPPWKWLVGFLIRVATFTRKDKRPTVVNHVATVIRAIREVDIMFIGMTGELDAPELHALSEIDTYYGMAGLEMHDVDGRPIAMPATRGPIVDWMIGEALGKGGFHYTRLLDRYSDTRHFSIAFCRHLGATDDHRTKIVEACDYLRDKNVTYGFLKIAAHVGDFALTRVWNLIGGRSDVYAFRWLCRLDRYPMCSWSSLYVYDKAGLPFDVPVEIGSPDDLWDECLVKTDVWMWGYHSPALDDEFARATRRARATEKGGADA